jgi:hypothetical protein
MGAGWSTLQAGAGGTFSIAGFIDLPWTEANKRKKLTIRLLSTDGSPVIVPTPMGDAPFVIEAEFEIGRPPGVPQGMTLSFPTAMTVQKPPLSVGQYEIRIQVSDGISTSLPFIVHEPRI